MRNLARLMLLAILCFLIEKVVLFSNAHESINFGQHNRIDPNIFHALHKRAIENTSEKDGLHATYIQIAYEYKNEAVILDLMLNNNLIPKGHFVSTQKPNGDLETKKFTKNDVDLCHYRGTIRNNPQSSVALSTCDGIRGLVFDGEETFSIENDGKNQNHFLIKHADLELDHKFGHKNGVKANVSKLSRFRRSAEERNEVHAPYNSNKWSNYVEFVIVVDNRLYKNFEKDIRKIHKHCKDIANIMNSIYAPLNIFIILKGVVIWSERDMIDVSTNGDKTLNAFLDYRKRFLLKDHPNDNAQLLTGVRFDNGVVGKALRGPICTHEFSGGVIMDHHKLISIVASTMAHEMGHNFGMEHDFDYCECPDKLCVMSESSSQYFAPMRWSSCSIEQLAIAIGHGMNSCLKNIPERLFASSTCGNGFLEPGEQCDCGFPENCNNTCCNPQTCMLHSNATCATGSCCNLSTCKPHTAGTKCREAFGECDLPEFCTGESEFCPSDVFKRDTEECQDGKAFCYQGSCKTHDDQCKVLWGPSGFSSDQCYKLNEAGNVSGNCGYDRNQSKYFRCKQEDVKCGMLQCRHLNEKLEIGFEQNAYVNSFRIDSRDSVMYCKTAIVDFGLETRDPGLTPDGANCGDQKMCFKQKCMPIEKLRIEEKILECPDCNGNGVCNMKGHCHCDDGWAPPFCDKAGPGGSVDSGPASDPRNHILLRITFILLLGVLPCCLVFAVSICIFRKKLSCLNDNAKGRSKKFSFRIISKSSIRSGMFLSSTNPRLLSNSTDLLNVDLGEDV